VTEAIQPDILHLEACNFIDKPMGGQLTFSRQLIKVLGNRVALVGLSNTPSEPIGCWFNKEIEGTVYRYFAIGRDSHTNIKPIVPGRLTTLLQIKRYQHSILSIRIPNIIISEHSILMALSKNPLHNLCFCNPGVDSPLSISRYFWAGYFSSCFDHFFLRSLAQKADCILAAADESAIAEFKKRAGEKLRGKNIISFPTRVDTDIFYPADSTTARKALGLPADAIIAVSTGRIHWAKGWEFLLESFKLFHERHPNAVLVFIGDGAEREALEMKALDLGMNKNIIIAGYQSPPAIATYLQASDLFIMGSLKEGWSSALVEALACHLPIVSTRFSSADTIVRQGANGFIVDRNPLEFSEVMEAALSLPDVAKYADSVIEHYALKNLAHDLFKVWSLV